MRKMGPRTESSFSSWKDFPSPYSNLSPENHSPWVLWLGPLATTTSLASRGPEECHEVYFKGGHYDGPQAPIFSPCCKSQRSDLGVYWPWILLRKKKTVIEVQLWASYSQKHKTLSIFLHILGTAGHCHWKWRSSPGRKHRKHNDWCQW